MRMYSMLVGLAMAHVLVLGSLSGCMTENEGGYVDGAEGPGIDPAALAILVKGVEEAVFNYVSVKVEGDPTPEQQLAISLARMVLNFGLYELEKAGAYEEAVRLRAKAGLVEGAED